VDVFHIIGIRSGEIGLMAVILKSGCLVSPDFSFFGVCHFSVRTEEETVGGMTFFWGDVVSISKWVGVFFLAYIS